MVEIPEERWVPLALDAAAEMFAPAPFTWCFAGGYAVEQFVGRPFRAHEDTDVLVFRDTQLALQHWLPGWQLYASDPPGTLRPWADGEYLPVGVHDLWGHRDGADAWELQLMLAETEGDEWVYRRDSRIRGPRDDLMVTYNGLPCIRIEVQLLYKSKGLRPKDEIDFRAALPLMTADAKHWLRDSLSMVNPDDHPWIEAL